MASPYDSEQLELWPELARAAARVPWGGRSPRDLTKVGLALIFQAGADKSASDDGGFVQLELFVRNEKAPWLYQGAPLLLEVSQRR